MLLEATQQKKIKKVFDQSVFALTLNTPSEDSTMVSE